jgi:hypothetical protein
MWRALMNPASTSRLTFRKVVFVWAAVLPAALLVGFWVVAKRSSLPVTIRLGPAITQAKGVLDPVGRHDFFLAPDGSLWSWGEAGFLSGPKWTNPVPERVGRTNLWLDVSKSADSLAGIRPDGTLWGWGGRWLPVEAGITNRHLMHRGSADLPDRLSPDSGWKSVTAGLSVFCALKHDGTLWTWGENKYGELGLGHYDSVFSPRQVGATTKLGRHLCRELPVLCLENRWISVGLGAAGSESRTQCSVTGATGCLFRLGQLLGELVFRVRDPDERDTLGHRPQPGWVFPATTRESNQLGSVCGGTERRFIGGRL